MITQRFSHMAVAFAALVLTSASNPVSADTVCTSNFECPDGHYCHKPAGECVGEGACAPMPTLCPAIWAPVCGCNGNTYGNACEAAAAGVNVSHEGECGEMPCTTTSRCPAGFWCSKATGDCDGEGECIPIFEGFCIMIYDPVCGCDGQTYGNPCMAGLAGMNIAHLGECEAGPAPDSCVSDADCDENFWCSKALGDCDGEGVCIPELAGFCDPVFQPVCGCDGVTYLNPCSAGLAYMNIAHLGECGTGASCGPLDACPEGQFCARPDGECDAEGICTPMPVFCPLIGAPVCGCDGVTYDNACFANGAGTSVAHEGECESPCPGDLTGDSNVGVPDLLALLSAWGPCLLCPADLTGDGNVGVADLLVLLGNWGACSP